MKLSSRKDKETEQKEKLEGGFSLYMNGAHKKEKFTPRHTVAKDGGRKKRMFNFAPHLMPAVNDLEALKAMSQAQESNSNSNSTPSTVRGRKKWNSNMSSITIKTQDGANIKIKPNNSTESTTETPRVSNDSHDDSRSTEFLQFDPDHYSYDFESDESSDIEEEIGEDIAVAGQQSDVKKSLIEDVKFSDLSDDEEDENAGTLKLPKPGVQESEDFS